MMEEMKKTKAAMELTKEMTKFKRDVRNGDGKGKGEVL